MTEISDKLVKPQGMDDAHFMKYALQEAQNAMDEQEVPVGAVVVMNGKIIARGHNMTEKLQDPTAHAEMIALTAAFNALGSKYLPEATLYVTLEPCPMCAGALYWSKIGRIVYGADDVKNGYKRVAQDRWPFHKSTALETGCCAAACAQLMKDFFQQRR
jgi:tRNA(adenine34) deaminase